MRSLLEVSCCSLQLLLLFLLLPAGTSAAIAVADDVSTIVLVASVEVDMYAFLSPYHLTLSSPPAVASFTVGSKPRDYWRLEKSMRSIPVWKFKTLKPGELGYDLKMRVLRNGSEEAIKDTLVLQNDGDEIPLAEVSGRSGRVHERKVSSWQLSV